MKSTDYKGWAHGLKKAGYATDPRYPQKLIELIERYEFATWTWVLMSPTAEASAERPTIRQVRGGRKPAGEEDA